MTPIRTAHDSGDHSARRAALRAELYAHFFLPPPEEIADLSLLSRLSVPIDLDRFVPADPVRRRRLELLRERVRVARLPAANHAQRQLRCLVVEMLGTMARELLGPGDEQALETWQTAASAYLRVLELPVMATPRARTLLSRLINARWGDVEQTAVAICGSFPPASDNPDI